MTDYDVIIIGGGPGGSTTGAFLARAGQRVLILEKETFPRFHIGESLLPFGNDVLKASGVWPKVQAGGFMRKLGAEFFTGNSTSFQRFWFSGGLVPGYGETFHVERSRFDHILLNHAAECGCEVKQRSPVKNVALDSEGATVAFAGTEQARTRWIVDASGRDTFLGRALDLPRDALDIPKRAAVYAHFKGVFRNPGDAAGHITIVRLKNGWCWSIPLDEEKTSLGLVVTMEDLKQAGGSVENWFDGVVAGSTELRKRLACAERVSEYYTASDYSYRYATMAQPRALLVGDASGFIDPIFSSGVYIAMKSAEMAAGLIVNADKKRRALTAREQTRYTRELHRITDIYYDMIRMYYDNVTFEVFMRSQSRFKIVQSINSLLAGNTRRSFVIWSRMKMFQLICRIHRRVPIVPRLDYTERPAAMPVRSLRAKGFVEHRTVQDPTRLYRTTWFELTARLSPWLGRTAIRGSGKALGFIYYLTHPRTRAAVRHNLALLSARPVERRLVRRTFTNFGATMADYFVMGTLSKAAARALATERLGFEHLQSAESRKGALIVTAHLGLFELGGLAMEEYALPTVILSLPEPTPSLGAWRARFRKRWGVDTLEVGEDQFGSLAVIQKIKQGNFVALLVDRPYNEHHVLVDFPNGKVPFSTGPVWLSLLSGRPIVAATVVWLPTGGYRLELHPPLYTHWLEAGRDETVRHFTEQLAIVFRKTICDYPDQWYQFVPLSS